MKKRLAAIIISVLIVLSLPMSAFAAPAEIPTPDAPYGMIASEPMSLADGSFTGVQLFYLVSNEMTAFTSLSYDLLSSNYDIDPTKTVYALQVDFSVNSEKDWVSLPDLTNLGTSDVVRSAIIFLTSDESDTSSYDKYLISPEGSAPILDTQNNLFNLRARFNFSFTTANGTKITKTSEWSEICSFGKGADKAISGMPTSLDAPKISDISGFNPNDIETTVAFTPTLPESVKEAALVCLFSGVRVFPQAQYKVGNGEWTDTSALDGNYLPCSPVSMVISEYHNLEEEVFSVRYRFCTSDGTVNSAWSNALSCGAVEETEAISESVSEDTSAAASDGNACSTPPTALTIALIAALVVLVVAFIIIRNNRKGKKADAPAVSEAVKSAEETTDGVTDSSEITEEAENVESIEEPVEAIDGEQDVSESESDTDEIDADANGAEADTPSEASEIPQEESGSENKD